MSSSPPFSESRRQEAPAGQMPAVSQPRPVPQLVRTGGLTLPPLSAAIPRKPAVPAGQGCSESSPPSPINTSATICLPAQSAAVPTATAPATVGSASATLTPSIEESSGVKKSRSQYVFLCRYGCRGIYKTGTALQSHMQNFHNIVEKAKIVGTCEACGRKFGSDSTWSNHGDQGCEPPSDPNIVAGWSVPTPITDQEKADTFGKKFGACWPSQYVRKHRSSFTEDELSKRPPVAPRKYGWLTGTNSASTSPAPTAIPSPEKRKLEPQSSLRPGTSEASKKKLKFDPQFAPQDAVIDLCSPPSSPVLANTSAAQVPALSFASSTASSSAVQTPESISQDLIITAEVARTPTARTDKPKQDSINAPRDVVGPGHLAKTSLKDRNHDSAALLESGGPIQAEEVISESDGLLSDLEPAIRDIQQSSERDSSRLPEASAEGGYSLASDEGLERALQAELEKGD